ncbi:hypothetical protein LRAMOSA04046 [Lichtheimia ramosa]|uniref:F-box domain-containing protein n=1 Tax=Lichtheimia ramosa TaxID=688394 RepID=A0A077WXK6_9FUNG|nr:hypothetical protein LRAMOSA04046 [Lichtheimia ramosa]
MLASSTKDQCAPPLPTSTDSSSAIGYLDKGRAYSERGYQRMAINMYDEGLAKTASSDPLYLQLQQAKKDAEERDNTRIDFISRLPMDILTWIAPRLIHGDLPLENGYFEKHHAPLLVSKAWYQRLMEAGHVHYKDSVYQWEPEHCVQYARFVKSLTLDLYGVSFDSLWSLGPTFDSLKKLSVRHMPNRRNVSAPFEPDRIVEGLRVVGDSLTHLKLHYHSIDSEATIPLQSVLDTCPHLTTLDIHHVDPDLSGATITFPRLTTLHLDVKTPVSNQVMTQLLNKLPCLESFSINLCSDKMIVATFLDHCPSLRYVDIGAFCDDLGDPDDDQHDYNTQFPKRYRQLSAGKMKLALRDMPSNPFTPQELITILKHYSPVLETLVISAKIPNVPQQADPFLQLHHVKQLVVTFPDLSERDVMDTLVGLPGFIMRHTPNVERIAIRQGQVDSSTMQVMTQLSHLKDLEVSVDYLEEDDDAHDMFTFLNHHKSLGTQSTLERLHIYSVERNEPTAPFYGIDNLSNLRELCIQAGFALTTRYVAVDDLIRIAETCPKLTCLSLQGEDGITDRIMYCLHHFKNLKELHVIADEISEAGALSCLACRHLEELEISCLNRLDHIFPLLKNVVPKVYSTYPLRLDFLL